MSHHCVFCVLNHTHVLLCELLHIWLAINIFSVYLYYTCYVLCISLSLILKGKCEILSFQLHNIYTWRVHYNSSHNREHMRLKDCWLLFSYKNILICVRGNQISPRQTIEHKNKHSMCIFLKNVQVFPYLTKYNNNTY